MVVWWKGVPNAILEVMVLPVAKIVCVAHGHLLTTVPELGGGKEEKGFRKGNDAAGPQATGWKVLSGPGPGEGAIAQVVEHTLARWKVPGVIQSQASLVMSHSNLLHRISWEVETVVI